MSSTPQGPLQPFSESHPLLLRLLLHTRTSRFNCFGWVDCFLRCLRTSWGAAKSTSSGCATIFFLDVTVRRARSTPPPYYAQLHRCHCWSKNGCANVFHERTCLNAELCTGDGTAAVWWYKAAYVFTLGTRLPRGIKEKLVWTGVEIEYKHIIS